jgi:Domain of unknown function (DUF4416)
MPIDSPLVNPFAALLYREPEALQAALERLAAAFSPVERLGAAHAFDRTDYYAPEMGTGLERLLVAFQRLEAPGWLVPAKLAAAGIEDALRVDGRRRVNVDVGYLDLGKVVLASFKERPTKLYLERGVWADLTLTFADGAWHPLPWSFPDFRDGRYDAELLALRERYKARLRERGPGSRAQD